MINSNMNRSNYLIEKYPKPPQGCPKNKVLYRVTFRYKSNFSGNKMYDVTDNNFGFKTTGYDRKIGPGSLVLYNPPAKDGKQHPNTKQIATITKESGPPKGRDAQRLGLPIQGSKESILYDLKFLQPLVVNNKVVNLKTEVPEKHVFLVPKLEAYICAESFVPIDLINNYIKARNAVRVDPNGSVPPPFNSNYSSRRVWLQAQENALWNNNFVMDANNQPKYPRWSGTGTPYFSIQQDVRKKLNRDIEFMVETGFMPNKKNNKPHVHKKGKNKFLNFNVPEGANPGQTITINVDGLSIVVIVPIILPDGSVPKTNERITVPIEKSLNDSIYENIRNSVKKSGPKLEFIPTLIEAQYSNDKHLNLEKMVKPSKNQKFKITSARILKHKNPVHINDDNFKFKPLIEYDKNISQLVFDIEVDVDLVLHLSEELSKNKAAEIKKEEKNFVTKSVLNTVGRKVSSLILNGGNNCPSRMRKLKQHGSAMLLSVIPQSSNIVKEMKKNLKATSEANKIHNQAMTKRNENILSGRKSVRRGGGKKTKQKKIKKRQKKTRRKYGGNNSKTWIFKATHVNFNKFKDDIFNNQENYSEDIDTEIDLIMEYYEDMINSVMGESDIPWIVMTWKNGENGHVWYPGQTNSKSESLKECDIEKGKCYIIDNGVITSRWQRKMSRGGKRQRKQTRRKRKTSKKKSSIRGRKYRRKSRR